MMIQIYDRFIGSSKDLHHSLQVAGYQGPAIALQDDGFLPESVTSAYAYFTGMDRAEGQALYFNQVPVQSFWEITGTNQEAEIWEYDVLKGKIFYTEPAHRRLVKAVDWYDRSGKISFTDHYNRSGKLFSRTFFDEDSRRISRAYYNQAGQEVISENFVTQDILLTWKGQTHFFAGIVPFYHFYLEVMGWSQERVAFNSLSYPFFLANRLTQEGENILFWQEPIHDSVPGNMLAMFANKNRREKVIVQDKETYEKLRHLLPEEYRNQVAYLGYIYPSYRDNQAGKNVLIVTNSDQIEQLDFLLLGLPDYHFHIAALTEMSPRLMAYGQKDQVTLYPNVTQPLLNQLLQDCDLYLDINHGSEVDGFVRRAFEHNLAIVAFEHTAHNRHLTSAENILLRSQPDRFLERVKQYEQDPVAFIAQQRLGTGHETVAAYQEVLQ